MSLTQGGKFVTVVVVWGGIHKVHGSVCSLFLTIWETLTRMRLSITRLAWTYFLGFRRISPVRPIRDPHNSLVSFILVSLVFVVFQELSQPRK